MPSTINYELDKVWSDLNLPQCMAAYVGKNYERHEERILVIGESMYIFVDNAESINTDDFYNNKSPLSLEQQSWLNYRTVINMGYGGRFLKNIEKTLEKKGLSLNDIAMFNFFQRPKLGTGSKDLWTQKDIEMGVKISHEAIKKLRPTKVIFTSFNVVRLIETYHSHFYPNENFWDFAEKLNFKYISVKNPSSPLWATPKGRDIFEKFVEVHGQERFRQLSAQFEFAIYERNMDKLICLARDFQEEVAYMDEKRKGKCGTVNTQEDKEKTAIICKKARVAKKAKKICSNITELLQKCMLDMNNVVNAESSSDKVSKSALVAEMKIRRDIASKDANIEIAKFKDEFAEDEILKEQLEKGLTQITTVRDAQLDAINALISSVQD